jgi:hypothetical protein
MRRFAIIAMLAGVCGCGPVDNSPPIDGGMSDSGHDCQAPDPQGCTRAEAQGLADEWNDQKRNPREDWRAPYCGDAEEIVHVSRLGGEEPGKDYCDWTVGRWDGDQWNDKQGPGDWQPVCIC